MRIETQTIAHMSRHNPPITLTPRIISLVAEIGELVGGWKARGFGGASPRLRRENRIRTIQGSLAIENNSLTVDQVTAILDGKVVLGSPREIQEVRNAIECYDRFADGNGRIGRLWQSLALAAWHAELAWLPVESLIRDRQSGYYQALGESDQLADSSPFVDFMLAAIRDTLAAAPSTDQVGDQVGDQVKSLLKAFGRDAELSAEELLRRLDLRCKPTFRKNHLNPALAAGWLEMTEPSSPRSPTQRYRLTNRALHFI